jgi:hypothetical protein
MLARPCFSASGLVTAMQIAKAEPSSPVENHLWPRMTHSAPSFFAVVPIHTGLLPANSGSVMVKQLRISPRMRGMRYRSFCSGVPNSMRSSMLPTSGAWQLKR